jgi:hypothetical protein
MRRRTIAGPDLPVLIHNRQRNREFIQWSVESREQRPYDGAGINEVELLVNSHLGKGEISKA